MTGPCACGRRAVDDCAHTWKGIRLGSRAWRGRGMGSGWPVAPMTRPCACGRRAVDGWCAHWKGIRLAVTSVAWSGDGQWLASSADDRTVRVWEASSGRLCAHWKGIRARSRAWRGRGMGNGWPVAPMMGPCACGIWKAVQSWRCNQSRYSAYSLLDIAFLPDTPVTAVLGKTSLGDDDVLIETPELELHTPPSTPSPTSYVSAKIVLVGESNVGKSCLALRLAQDRYEEQGTTHGMRLWTMPPEQLSLDMVAPPGEKREVVIWDLGGQDAIPSGASTLPARYDTGVDPTRSDARQQCFRGCQRMESAAGKTITWVRCYQAAHRRKA